MDAGAHTLDLDGCRLHWWSFGREDAPAVVLSHGATLDHESWAPQVAPLAERYRVISWDMRGHGRSQPLTGKLTLERGAADLAAVLDAAGVARAALVGLSMGSFVSQELAYQRPGRVAALASFDATQLTGLRMGPMMSALMRASGAIMQLYPKRVLVESIARGAAIIPATQAYIRRVVGGLQKQAIIDIWSAVQTGLRWEPDYRPDFPLMIAVGEQDRIGLTAKGCRDWAAARPDARFEVIPDAGHCANQDNPQHATRILLDFLSEYWPA